MKTSLTLLLWLGILVVSGCKQADPPPPGPGVNVVFPGGGVNVSPGGATSVNAPAGVAVRAQ